jgi:hypothetical protein
VPFRAIIGPPESPWHVSCTPSPAHTIVLASTTSPSGSYAAAQSASETIGTSASSSTELVEPDSVVPQPMILASVPGVHSDA